MMMTLEMKMMVNDGDKIRIDYTVRMEIQLSILILSQTLWIVGLSDLLNNSYRLDQMITAIETKYGVLSTPLIDTSTTKSSGLAQRLARRYAIQVFLADTLPELHPEQHFELERRLVEALGDEFNVPPPPHVQSTAWSLGLDFLCDTYNCKQLPTSRELLSFSEGLPSWLTYPREERTSNKATYNLNDDDGT